MDIPEDVMEAAMLHLRSMEQDTEERGNGQWVVKGFGVRNAIARAIVAEREAQRERDARVCERQAYAFLSPEYAADQPLGSFSERFACASCADAIRSTPNQTGEVDRT